MFAVVVAAMGSNEQLVLLAVVGGAVTLIALALALTDNADERRAREGRFDPDLSEHVYRLRVDSTDSPIPAALLQEMWPRLAEFLNVDDKFGVAELAERGHVALLPAETMVRRIKVSGLLAEIRIEDGEHRGVLAWTLASHLTKER